MAQSQHQGLLEYDPEHRIIICTQCNYAIQPKAISRHLKELHHIYRGDRTALLNSTANLEICDPVEILLPLPDSCPVRHLPVESGLACNYVGCGHLCITLKRMKRHWVTKHGVAGTDGVDWRPVKLQTFFRGTHLRYFIVRPVYGGGEGPPASQSQPQSGSREQTYRGRLVNAATTQTSSDSESNARLLEHYTVSTYATLVQREEGPEFWRTSILDLAHLKAFVMHALLAISALHLASIGTGTSGKGSIDGRDQTGCQFSV